MADQPSTPGDPLWFLHHAVSRVSITLMPSHANVKQSIDRMWNIWQTQDLDNRVNTVADTLTILNFPASRDATLEDEVTLNYIGGKCCKVNLISSSTLSLCRHQIPS